MARDTRRHDMVTIQYKAEGNSGNGHKRLRNARFGHTAGGLDALSMNTSRA